MSEHTHEALRRQTALRAFVLAIAGTGSCPLCHQKNLLFSRRRMTPGAVKERCLDCWRAEP
jgi:hypothetical protein